MPSLKIVIKKYYQLNVYSNFRTYNAKNELVTKNYKIVAMLFTKFFFSLPRYLMPIIKSNNNYLSILLITEVEI